MVLARYGTVRCERAYARDCAHVHVHVCMNMQKERVVLLVDMDCFYVQVEQRLAPETRSRPCAVVQYNAWRGGR